MTRRSTPQHVTDEKAFPVRLFILVPLEGFGPLLGLSPDAIHPWLDREIGRGNYAVHAGGRVAVQSGLRDKTAFYFRHPDHAARFLAAFPQLELADGTTSITYKSPMVQSGRR